MCFPISAPETMDRIVWNEVDKGPTLTIEDVVNEEVSRKTQKPDANIIESLRRTYGLDVTAPNILFCNRDPILYVPSVDIPDMANYVSIEKNGDVYNWDLDLPDTVECHLSATTLSKVMPRKDLSKIRHEFVSEAFQLGETDAKLSKYYKSVDDGQDILTPDFIFVDESGVVHVVEIATTRAVDDKQIGNIISDKLFKYENALFLRSQEKTTTLSVILINHQGVYSTIPLSTALVNDLSIRYRIMIGLENVARSKGISIFLSAQEEQLNLTALEIKESIESIKVDGSVQDDGVLITSEYINTCLGPINHESVKDAFSTSFKANPAAEGRKWEGSKLIDDTDQDSNTLCNSTKRHLESFAESFKEEPRMRTNKIKPILNLPNIIPARTEPSTLVQFKNVGSGSSEHILISLWKEAFAGVNNSESWKEMSKRELLKESYETRQDVLKNIRDKRKLRMKTRARTQVKLNPGTERAIYLAKDGIKGKNTKNEGWRKLRKIEQSKSYHYETSTQDIDDYLSSKEMYEFHGRGVSQTQGSTMELIKLANQIAHNKDDGERIIANWQETNLMEYADFVSDLSAELTVTLRQHTKRNELILKKMRNYNCYLLLSPSGLKNPIGVSIMIPKTTEIIKLNNFIGREMIETNSCFLTKFVTISPDKLENMYNLPGVIISMVSFLAHFFSIKNMTVSNCMNVLEFTKMLNFLLAIRMEDKAETEESITQTRYMYMESMRTTAPIVKPEPLKVLSKLTNMPRSRLNLWIIKRIIDTFTVMTERPPKRLSVNDLRKDSEDDDPLPTDNWSGLINFITGVEISSASNLLNLFYIGYLKNKNALAQGNTNWALLEKTLKEEISVDWDDLEGISGNARTDQLPKSHQFNVECVKAGVESLEKRLHQVYGNDWKNVIGDRILTKLSTNSTFSMATLKASSTTRDSDVHKRMTKTSNPPVKRRKVLSAILDNIKLYGRNPFTKIHKFIAIRKNGTNKVRADLFKKQQHGGLREIFVMDEITRPIQLAIETISRVICSEFEEESLTNPKKKLPIINNHFRKSKRYAAKTNRNSINYNSSMDKMRWSQGLLMRVLSIALFRLTPSYMHGLIQQALNMWVGKHVKIPPEVIDMLLNDVRLSSKAYMRLHAEFYGQHKLKTSERPILAGERQGYVTLQTGFMQGILHYTSSLLHLSYLSLVKSMITKVVNTSMKDCDILISYACSSDDSAMMTTLFLPEESNIINKKWIDYADLIEKLLHTIEIFCRFFCMRASTKSTVAMLDSVEFNSEFIFNNNLAIPTIKFVAATQNIVPYESFIDKLQGHYNLLSDAFSSGMPAFNTHMCQLAQAIMHYKTIGVGLSPLSDELVSSLLRVVEPGYGFFPLDSELCPGVMGFPFTQYMVSRHTGQMPISQKALRKEPLTIIESGSVSETLQVLHGDRKRQKKMLLDIHDQKKGIKRPARENQDATKYKQLLDDVMRLTREEVDDNYELFYRAAETERELYLKLELKVLMPGVAKSLMSSNVFVQTVSVALYSCHTDCITVTTERLDPALRSTSKNIKDVGKKSKVKISLLAALKLKEDELDAQEDKGFDNENLRSVCYPLHVRYDEAFRVIESFEGKVEIEVPRMRSQKNRIDIIPVRGRLPLTLLETVKAVWFGHTPRTSRTVLRRCLEVYKGQYPWLRDTHNESLEDSPFGTASEMFGFLNSAGESMRTMTVVSPSLNSTKMTSQLTKLIAKNYKSCTILRKPAEKKEVRFSTRNDRNSLDLSLLIPLEEERQAKVKKVLEGASIVDEGSLEPSTLNRRDLALYMIQNYHKGKLDSVQIGELLRQTKIGYHLFYLKEQRKITSSEGEVKWIGAGEILLHIGDDFMIMRINDDLLTSIHVRDIATVTRNLGLLRKAMEEMGVRPEMNRKRINAMLAKYNGDRVVDKSAAGCPIFKDKDTRRVIGDLKELQIELNKGCITLTHKVGVDRRSVLVKYTVRNSDIDTYSNRRLVQDFWHAWVQCDTWEFSKFRKTISDLKDHLITLETKLSNWRTSSSNVEMLKRVKKNLDEYKSFLSMTLKYRLGQRKSLKINPDDYMSTIGDAAIDEEDEYIDEEMIHELMMETYGVIDDQETGEPSDMNNDREFFSKFANMGEDDIDTIEEMVDHLDVMTDKGLMTMSRLISERLGDTPLDSVFSRKIAIEFKGDNSELIHRPNNVYANHPIWDDLINTIDNRDRRMLNNIMNGVVIGYDQELSRLLLWLLDIDEKDVSDKLQKADNDYEDPAIRRVREYLARMEESELTDSDDETPNS